MFLLCHYYRGGGSAAVLARSTPANVSYKILDKDLS